ncbi:hypothetical protein PG985_005793 [Apiospora marii]|uniref:uncharacterized protein n=1 Tax=Apiospora marii TaxID=335849 RepID=UPI00312E410C
MHKQAYKYLNMIIFMNPVSSVPDIRDEQERVQVESINTQPKMSPETIEHDVPKVAEVLTPNMSEFIRRTVERNMRENGYTNKHKRRHRMRHEVLESEPNRKNTHSHRRKHTKGSRVAYEIMDKNKHTRREHGKKSTSSTHSHSSPGSKRSSTSFWIRNLMSN